eukprot:EC691510.1.p7 GENE.EC691510.1~~EC691510.1.p7  ORF type:complete len:58 (-),score=8.68 EC691510.1:267-440(-)
MAAMVQIPDNQEKESSGEGGGEAKVANFVGPEKRSHTWVLLFQGTNRDTHPPTQQGA